MVSILIDTNVVAGLLIPRDQYHQKSLAFIRSLPPDERAIIFPVLFELFHLTRSRLGYEGAVELFARARIAFHVIELVPEDYVRVEQILEKYKSARFDLTDAALMAVAERLNIRQIATFDRRDFSIYQPTHCDHFDLLPEDNPT